MEKFDPSANLRINNFISCATSIGSLTELSSIKSELLAQLNPEDKYDAYTINSINQASRRYGEFLVHAQTFPDQFNGDLNPRPAWT